MHEAQGWMLDARVAKAAIVAWFVVALVYGFWRSRGAAPADAIRESGPII